MLGISNRGNFGRAIPLSGLEIPILVVLANCLLDVPDSNALQRNRKSIAGQFALPVFFCFSVV
jgi:hypothetical protein